MPRARLISPAFWTSEAVVNCAPMTRLLLLGLSTFADNFGVLPLRPRTLRLQVFPGDAVDDDQMRAIIEEQAARGLMRRYTVDGVEYLSIVDWALHQRVGKRARRRYPAEKGAGVGEAAEELTASVPPPDDSKPLQSASAALQDYAEPPPAPITDDPPSYAAAAPQADACWHNAIDAALQRACGGATPVDAARYADRCREEDRDLALDVLPAIDLAARIAADCRRPLSLDAIAASLAVTPPPPAAACVADAVA